MYGQIDLFGLAQNKPGVISAGLLLLVTLSSLATFRNKSYTGYGSFRAWHRWLSIAITATALFHVVFSGFYIVNLWQAIGLFVIAIAAYFLPSFLISRMAIDASFKRSSVIIISVVAVLVFCILRVGVNV